MEQIKRYAGAGAARFPAAEYPVDTEPCIFEKRRYSGGSWRNTLRLTLCGDPAEIKAAFADNSAWYIEEENAGACTRYDKSSFCLAGDLVDHRDGRVTIYMAEPTEEEQRVASLERENAQLLFENLTGGSY